jgi:lipid-A-disaccharide synthase
MREALALDPSLSFVGIGGAAMREAGLRPLFRAEEIAVVGFLEVVRHLPRLRRAFGACVEEMRQGVDAAVLVDYPGFNLRLASRARGEGVPVLYFISPQVWAWKPGRIDRIARDVDRMLVLFPFEVDLYRGKGIEVEYVGHPLVEAARAAAGREEAARRIGIDPSRPTLGILPGSRASEVRRNLPPALGAARILRRFFRDLQLVLPAAPGLDRDGIEPLLGRFPDLGVALTSEPFYDVLSVCRAAIVSSGTATLETALMEVPMVVIYRLHPLTALIARRMTTLETFGLVNIVAGRRVVPECIQENCTPERIAREIERFFGDAAHHEATVRALHDVRAKLGEPGAYARAARSLVGFLEARRSAAVPSGM